MTEPSGTLAVVLHTHMPYVEGFGTWPFGEEWLWEAMATCYLPLLDVLERADGRLTLSLTPVLCDQLEAPGIGERFLTFLREIRPESHARDIRGLRETGYPEHAAALEHSAARYASAAERFERDLDGDLLGPLVRHASWTSSATHAVLPLLATEAGLALQVETGVEALRARGGDWRGGFWLPECGYAEWVDAALVRAGVRHVCVDLTDRLGRGSAAQLRPLRTPAGLTLAPIDRAILELVWSPGGYPSRGPYRDTHRLTTHRHQAWAVDGAPYDPARALAQAREDARDFVARAVERLAEGGLSICALDTELLGHWWPEGVDWLGFVVEEADAAGLRLRALDGVLDGLLDHAQAPPEGLGVTSWGTPRDLSTWAGPPVAELLAEQRAAELAVACAAEPVPERALRELLALQSSDWAFLISGEAAGPYPRERADGHLAALRAALAGAPEGSASGLRNLAPRLRAGHARLP